MNVQNIVELTGVDSDEPLYNTVFDDIDGLTELENYARYDYVKQVMDSFASGPSSYLKNAYSQQLMDYQGPEQEFWINEIVQEAAFYLREVKKWISHGLRSDALIKSFEDLKQYPNVLDTTAYLLKGKARHINRIPLVRVYLLQIGDENDEPEWYLLFEGIKFEYEISKNPGIVASVYKRTNLLIEELERILGD